MTSATRQYLLPLLFLALALPFEARLHAQQAAVPDEVKQFQQVEDKWSIAYTHKDQYGMELLLSPTFVNVSATGAVSTRNELIAQMFDHTAGDLLSMEQRAVNVRLLGDIALVEGTYIIHYRVGSHSFDERGVFTHVYQRARNNWGCVNAQRTAVFDQSDEKGKAGKKSDASLPFHIPLIYKGAVPAQSVQNPANNPPPPQ